MFLVGFGMGCKGEEPVEMRVRPVPAMKVGDVTSLLESTFPGRVQATDEVNLAFRVSGPLIERPVDVGDFVKRGDVVARIDPRDYETALANISSNVAREKAELQAMRIARPEDIQRAKAQLTAAEAEQLKANADYRRVQQLVDSTG